MEKCIEGSDVEVQLKLDEMVKQGVLDECVLSLMQKYFDDKVAKFIAMLKSRPAFLAYFMLASLAVLPKEYPWLASYVVSGLCSLKDSDVLKSLPPRIIASIYLLCSLQ